MVYPPKDFPNMYDDFKGDQDPVFSVVPSIRYEGIVDGITDFLYLQKIEKTIAALKKQEAGDEVAKGEAILAKWEDYFSRRTELFVESKEFDQARWKMGDFISTNARARRLAPALGRHPPSIIPSTPGDDAGAINAGCKAMEEWTPAAC